MEVVLEGGKSRAFAFGLLLAALIAAGLLLAAKPAQANTFAAGDEQSLRAAIEQARNSPGHDFIDIDPNTGQFIHLNNGSIEIDDSGGLIIEGNGGTVKQTGLGPAFSIMDNSSNVVINELEITGVQGGGASISNFGGDVYLANSTVHGNSGPAGGIHNAGGGMFLVNSTVSGNDSYGILNEGSLIAYFSTVTDNGTGIHNTAGSSSTTLGRSIVAGNSYRDVEGAFVTQGHNLVGKGDGSTGLTDGVGHDQVGTGADPIDPGLRPLGYSEPGPDIPLPQGPTPTHPLRIASPAVDAIDTSNCPLYVSIPPYGSSTPPFNADQRGVDRPWGPACDIGAFEREPRPAITVDDAYSAGEDTPLTVGAQGGVLGNDENWGSPIVVAEPRPASEPLHGTLTLEADGSFTYTPEAGFTGMDSFSYRASHGGLLTSDPATATITVEPGDNIPPQLNLPADISAEATSASGAAVSFTATATDEDPANPTVSCTKDDPPVTVTSGDTFPLGTTKVDCSAEDADGNEATGSFYVKVNYSWSGLLQPINGGSTSDTSDDDSVFKRGSTVPVKFKLSGNSAGISDATARLYVSKVSNSVAGDEVEGTSTSSADTGNTFRYDATSNQYIFNLSTKGTNWTAGTYQLRIDLGDGTTNTVRFSLK